MVARGMDPSEVYQASLAELSGSLGVANVALLQYESDEALVLSASRDEHGRGTDALGPLDYSKGTEALALGDGHRLTPICSNIVRRVRTA
jgi:hypothetical protein